MISATTTRPASARRRGAAIAALASVTVLIVGCTGGSERAGAKPAAPDDRLPIAASSAFEAGLVAFDSCEGLLDYYRSKAGPLIGPYGLPGAHARGGEVRPNAESSAAASGPADAREASGSGFSGTNNQEEGVDEADVIKTDGRLIVTSLMGKVHVTDAAAGTRLSTIPIPKADGTSSELLLSGKTLIVLTTTGIPIDTMGDARIGFPGNWPGRTTVTRVDLSDPAAPKVLGAVRVEGSYRSARMIGDSVRMVLVSQPTWPKFKTPQDNSLGAERDATRENRKAIASSTIDDWVPHYELLDAEGNAEDPQRLLDCGDLSRPREFAGLSTLSVLTFDAGSPEGRITPTSTVGVLAGGDTIYASQDRLIVATSPWDLWMSGWRPGPNPPKTTTALHTFDISDPATTTYAGSGSVAGHLVNQFAMDEQDGVVRVATTTSGPDWNADSQSSLVVLRLQGGRLVKVGQVDGMGLTEHIRSVRYLSPDLAAVVTFRQTDPLYLVDTSDPTKPRVAGELKIPGYSAYLHPVGEGRLLGIGQDADKSGQTTGLQASLFDVSDPAKPARLDQVTWKRGNSPVEWEHRAFLSWAGKVYLPATIWSNSDSNGHGFGGVLTLNVADRTLTEGKRAASERPSQYPEEPQRLVVIGDDLWTLDRTGLERFDLATMTYETGVRLLF